jgi:hypothetical protein
MQKSRQPAGKGGEDRMDEDSKRHQWRIKVGFEKERKPIIIRRSDIKKRAENRKNRLEKQ